jgi:hypothetical protein
MPQVSRAPLQLAVPIGGKPNDRAFAGPPDTPGRLGEPPGAVPAKAKAHAGQDLREAQGARSEAVEVLDVGNGERS